MNAKSSLRAVAPKKNHGVNQIYSELRTCEPLVELWWKGIDMLIRSITKNMSNMLWLCYVRIQILLSLWMFWWSQVNYGNFMHGLMKENIQLNRKVLSELSMHEPYSFKALVEISRKSFPGNKVPPRKEGLSILVWTFFVWCSVSSCLW